MDFYVRVLVLLRPIYVNLYDVLDRFCLLISENLPIIEVFLGIEEI